jgi:hypothetical protein
MENSKIVCILRNNLYLKDAPRVAVPYADLDVKEEASRTKR